MEQPQPTARPTPPLALEPQTLNLNFSSTPWLPTPSPTLRLPTPTLEALASTDWASLHYNTQSALASAGPNQAANTTGSAVPGGSTMPPSGLSALFSPKFDMMSPGVSGGLAGTLPFQQPPSQKPSTLTDLFMVPEYEQSFSQPSSAQPPQEQQNQSQAHDAQQQQQPKQQQHHHQQQSQQSDRQEQQGLQQQSGQQFHQNQQQHHQLSHNQPQSQVQQHAQQQPQSHAQSYGQSMPQLQQTTLPLRQTQLQPTFMQDPQREINRMNYTGELSRQHQPKTEAPPGQQMQQQYSQYSSSLHFPTSQAQHVHGAKDMSVGSSSEQPHNMISVQNVSAATQSGGDFTRPAKKPRPARKPFTTTVPSVLQSKVRPETSAVEEAASAAAAKAERFANERKRLRAAAAAQASEATAAMQRSGEDDSLDLENSGGVSSDGEPQTGQDDLKKKRYQRRLELNRQSAAVSRVRRREYVKELEDKLVTVEKEKFKLQSQVDLMSEENVRLRAQMKSLQSQMGKPPTGDVSRGSRGARGLGRRTQPAP